ncbi:MAG: 23S rRNA (cytidine(2498)-2'-O)-methyltransferase RlmM [Gammaproteobacteria bacterium]|nr:23S rRNA (cytidine(2498)-2'-O)-methyltransferase RlmM [Gammaproteobacteria bacterium]
MSSTVFLYCRPGFEGECAAEIIDQAGVVGLQGFCKAKPATGYVLFQLADEITPTVWFDKLRLPDLIFTRQWFFVSTLCEQLPLTDRATPLAQAVAEGGLKVLPELFLETPDSDEHKTLSPLCQALQGPLAQRLRARQVLDEASPWRIHICFLATDKAYVGWSPQYNNSTWRGGVPRLRAPAGAPSRSALKLEEAFLTLMSEDERARWLQPGMSAVDLGASPGGWTYQLVRRHIRVTAIDNGAIAPALMESGLVEHLRVDGFSYRPPKPVTWLVCDIVEQPIRTAELVARWVAQGWCQGGVVNLKLPMKKRYAEVQRCIARMQEILAAAGVRCTLRGKQLYHDRDEVTLCILPLQ